jgi:hypothetical protein
MVKLFHYPLIPMAAESYREYWSIALIQNPHACKCADNKKGNISPLKSRSTRFFGDVEFKSCYFLGKIPQLHP